MKYVLLLAVLCFGSAFSFDGCSLCTEIVQTAAGLLDEEEPVIAQKLHMVCNELGPLATICNSVVDSYLPQIIKWLEDGTHEKEICQKIGLCSSRAANLDSCSMCTTVVHYVSGMLGMEEPVIEAEVNKLCDALGPFAGTCKTVVDGYLKQIIQWLEDGTHEKEICQRIGLCTGKRGNSMLPLRVEAKISNGACSICKDIVGVVASLLDQTLPVIEAEVDKLCEDMGPVSSICKMIVNHYLEEIIDWLNKGTSVDEVCDKIGLCSTRKQTAVVAPKKYVHATPKGECSICTTIVGIVANLLDESEPEIEAEVDKACEELGPVASICKMLVSEYLPKVIKWLEDGESEKEVCSKLGLCATIMIEQQQRQNFDECNLCVTLVHTAKGMLDKPIDEIKKKMDEMCDQEAGGLAFMCKALVDQFAETVIKLLQDGVDEKQICVKIGMCSGQFSRAGRVLDPRVGGCDLCLMVAKTVSGLLHMEEPQIKAELDALCSKLGGFSGVCQTFVDKELDSVITWLQDGDNEKMVCQKLKLCSAKFIRN
jgi:saposin